MSNLGQGHWLDRMFKKKLARYEMQPSEQVWENIARHLDGEKRRPFLLGGWSQWMWTLVFLGLLGGLFAWWFWHKHQQNKASKHPMDLPYQFEQSKEGSWSQLSQSAQDAKTKNLSTNASMVKIEEKANVQNQSSFSSNHKFRKASVNSFQDSNKFSQESIQRGQAEESLNAVKTSADPIVVGATGPSTQSKADTYIVSSDPGFLPESIIHQTSNKTAPIPSLQTTLKSETHQKQLTKMAEGCNVYKNEKTHFFIDAYYAPEISNRSLTVTDPAMLTYAEKRANSEKPILSYSMGLRGSVIFSSGLAFRSGLLYSNNKERFDYVKETQIITIERKDKDGNVIGIETQINEIMDHSYNNYRQIDIPFILGYERDLKDFILSLNTGIGFNLSSSQSGKIYQPDQKTIYNLNNSGEGTQQVFKHRAGMSFLASVGLNYKYNERIMLMLEPSARVYFKSQTADDYPIKQKYSFFGINAGIRYRID